MEKPVVTAMNGAAFGGRLILALACDMIIAVKEANDEHCVHRHWSCTGLRDSVCYQIDWLSAERVNISSIKDVLR